MEVNDRFCFRAEPYIQTLRFADGQGHHIVTLHQQVRTLHVPTNSRASIHYLNHDKTRALLAAHPCTTGKSRRNRLLRRSGASTQIPSNTLAAVMEVMSGVFAEGLSAPSQSVFFGNGLTGSSASRGRMRSSRHSQRHLLDQSPS